MHVIPSVFRLAGLSVAIGLALSATSSAQANDPPAIDPCEGSAPCTGPTEPIVHPLRDTARPDGSVPVLDIKNAPSGKRYAVDEAALSNAEGQLTRRSGVVELRQRRPTSSERAAMLNAKVAANEGVQPPSDETPSPVIGPVLAARIAQSPAGSVFPVHLRVRRPLNQVNSVDEIERGIARGTVRTVGDELALRQMLQAQRRDRVSQALAPVVTAIEQMGGVVTARYSYLYGLSGKLTAPQIQQLAALPGVERMDLSTPTTDDVDGQDVSLGMQAAQFINNGWDGENGSDTDITFALLENGKINDDHLGFVDSSSAGSSPRIRGRYDCDSNSCDFFSDFGSPGDHATGVGAILFGDLRDGQDPTITDSLERKQKSGLAGEARGYVYAANYTTDGLREAYDHLLGRTYTPHVVNQSNGSETDDPTCMGDTALSKDVNDLFEEGLLVIKAAGNTPGSSTNCTVSSPGSAIGSFTVGSHGETTFGGDSNDVKTDPISSYSAMGGVSASQGVNRSIIDVTAYGCREDLFDTSGGYTYSGCGTSFSAPAVSGAALDHIDQYKNNTSDLIDNPGILFSHLLLMGDREGQSGNLSSGYDSLWGAGRLKMRKLDADGMDSPYGWGTGYTCVDDGQTVVIDINNGNAISSDADDFKAVIYWYDPRHEDGKSVSDLDLRLKTTGGTTLRSSIDYYDNKERVYYSAIGGQTVQLEIDGWDVKTDTTSCGSNSMKVYYAYFYEDDDRDDADGPGSLVDTE